MPARSRFGEGRGEDRGEGAPPSRERIVHSDFHPSRMMNLSSKISQKGKDREKAFVSPGSSGYQDADQRPDDPPEESDERVQDTQKKETDDDKEPVRFQAGEEIRGFFP